MQKLFLLSGSFFGALALLFGAFGAHYLKRILSSDMQIAFETGVRYQFYHAFALIITAWALGEFQNGLFNYAGWAFILGTLLFSGSIYILSTGAFKIPGIITPIGGLFLIFGWISLFFAFLRV